MSAIYEWIGQIILLIMLAMILELLLPNDSFRRYVKMVIGLVLIIALLTPIFKVVKTPVNELFQNIKPPEQADAIKNSLNTNVKVIESSNQEYIHKQMAVRMANAVQKELIKRYDLQVNNIDLTLNDENPQSPVEHADVQLGEAKADAESKGSDSKVVHPVHIKVTINEGSKKDKEAKMKKTDEIKAFLAQSWGIAPKHLSVHVEGG
ncbi:stage III sporulation protein AF [Camelliibacillus cellulosilyticus]|uniref:Stage III sporulation protein AF n=1 Tax=Camelliibacillus cellulosilyticus TaxID=2174486 RepID=A0ABV9GI32_9BACL